MRRQTLSTQANITDEEYDRVMNVNARGLFLTARAFVQGMIDQKSGRIINILTSCQRAVIGAFRRSSRSIVEPTRAPGVSLSS